jgi:hypothetical protein
MIAMLPTLAFAIMIAAQCAAMVTVGMMSVSD